MREVLVPQYALTVRVMADGTCELEALVENADGHGTTLRLMDVIAFATTWLDVASFLQGACRAAGYVDPCRVPSPFVDLS